MISKELRTLTVRSLADSIAYTDRFPQTTRPSASAILHLPACLPYNRVRDLAGGQATICEKVKAPATPR